MTYLKCIPNYADLYTLADFTDMVRSGLITNDDGTGYYATPAEMTDIRVDCASLTNDFSHVAWFNK